MASHLTLVVCTIKTRALKYVYSVFDPERFGGQLVTLVEYIECQVEIARVVPVARLIHDQRPSWGIPSVPEPSRVSYGAGSVIGFWPSWSTPICKASSSRPVEMTG